jgi:hypothetical protein
MEINAKRLYEHFKATGNEKQLNAILKKYPHFAEKPAEDKEVKSNGKKPKR